VKATIRPSTHNSYVQHVECHIGPHIGSVKLQKLSGSQVKALFAKFDESGRKDGRSGLSAMTIRWRSPGQHRCGARARSRFLSP